MFRKVLKKAAIISSGILGLLLLIFAITPAVGAQPDPNGQPTLLKNPNAPVDYAWVLISGSLVFFIQAGFAMVEAGFLRVKNMLT
jgi:Amt family ammonium transporter